jgi:hypothetical protein
MHVSAQRNATVMPLAAVVSTSGCSRWLAITPPML